MFRDQALGKRRRLLHDAPMMREHRDELAAEFYDTMVNLRKTISGAFGSGFEGQLFGTGKTPRDPFALTHLAGEIAHSLRNPKLQEQLSGNLFAQFDWDATADDVGGQAARLDEVLQALDANAAGQTSAVRRKDEAAGKRYQPLLASATAYRLVAEELLLRIESLAGTAGRAAAGEGLNHSSPRRR